MKTLSFYFRLVLILALVALAIALTYGLADSNVQIQGPSFSYEVSAPIALLLLCAGLLALAFLRKVISAVLSLPTRFKRWQSAQKATHAEQLLVTADQEYLLGHCVKASALIEELHSLGRPSPMSSVLEARIAQGADNFAHANGLWKALSERELTRIAGIIGGVVTAIDSEDLDLLNAWLSQLPQTAPRKASKSLITHLSPAVAAAVVTHAQREGSDAQAVATLIQSATDLFAQHKIGYAGSPQLPEADRQRISQCYRLRSAHIDTHAHKLPWLQRALDTHWQSAIADHVRTLVQANQGEQAKTLIETHWRRAASLSLAQLYADYEPGTDLQRLARLERLANLGAFPDDTFAFAIQVALKAQVFGRAEAWLHAWEEQSGTSPSSALAAATLEYAQHGCSERYQQLCATYHQHQFAPPS